MVIVDKKQLILFGIGLILITILVSVLFRRTDTSYVDSTYQRKIDSLNIELKYIRDRQTILGSQIKRYRDSIAVSNQRIDSLGKELISTREYYGKKIKDIGKYNANELSDFFSKRYK